MKGTYTVVPNADPTLIRWHYSGHTDLTIDAVTGDLLISFANGNVLREIALDSSGVFITGNTSSTAFFTPNVVQQAYSGGENDMFVTKLSDIP